MGSIVLLPEWIALGIEARRAKTQGLGSREPGAALGKRPETYQ